MKTAWLETVEVGTRVRFGEPKRTGDWEPGQELVVESIQSARRRTHVTVQGADGTVLTVPMMTEVEVIK